MKIMKFILLGIAFIAINACSGTPENLWFTGSFDDALKSAGDKIVMIDFYTDWCTWCNRLDADTYSDASVVEYSLANLVSLKIDAESQTGAPIASRYSVSGFPTILFLNSDGSEVDRIVGYMPPDGFLARVKNIVANTGTLSDLILQHNSNPDDFDISFELAEKYYERGEKGEAEILYNNIIENAGEKYGEIRQAALFRKAQFQLEAGQTEAMQGFIADNSDSRYALDGYQMLSYHYKQTENLEKELELLEAMLQNNPRVPSILNSYAWRMSELEMNLEKALKNIRIGIEELGDDTKSLPNFIDTEAEVLWKLGRIDEAVKRISVAIEMDTENDYLQQQKEKFLDRSKNGKTK